LHVGTLGSVTVTAVDQEQPDSALQFVESSIPTHEAVPEHAEPYEPVQLPVKYEPSQVYESYEPEQDVSYVPRHVVPSHEQPDCALQLDSSKKFDEQSLEFHVQPDVDSHDDWSLLYTEQSCGLFVHEHPDVLLHVDSSPNVEHDAV
jgi:hypothetical protein